MKELSIKEKAKRYDEAYRKVAVRFGSNVADEIFPELKENEDELHRKWILEYLYDGLRKSDEQFKDHFKAAIAWLEKQGEQKPYGQREECSDCEFRCGDKCIGSCVMKRGEQKPADNQFTPEQADVLDKHIDKFLEQKLADKVEPKFKIGEWVIYDHRAYQVVELPKEGYINLGLRRNGKIEFAPSTYCRHWTIQDAKEGDVLATENFIFIFKNIDNGNGVHYYCHYEIRKHEDDSQFGVALPQSLMGRVGNSVLHYSPATKEQRDLLFQKMKEAGYEWDAEKKELKKISQEYPLTPDECIKPAWSEEDKNILDAITYTVKNSGYKHCIGVSNEMMITFIKSLKDRVQPKQEWSEEDKEQLDRALYMMEQLDMTKSWDDVYNWLKSLRPQNRWKPNDKQMQALSDAGNSFRPFEEGHKVLWSLYNDLKKLKEE